MTSPLDENILGTRGNYSSPSNTPRALWVRLASGRDADNDDCVDVFTGKPAYYRLLKRLFDILFSLFVIILCLFPGLILCLLIMEDTHSSPLYLSKRVGKDGRKFTMLKFRTMIADSDEIEKHLSPEQIEQWTREHKVDDDPRCTRLGKKLRETSIDEFPQFVNVLLGQMSVVGPRAVTDEELSYYGEFKEILSSYYPGITGLWQVSERNAATFESGRRQEIELSYLSQASLALDARIIFRTIHAIFSKTGK